MAEWFVTENMNVVLPIIGQGLIGVFLVIGLLSLSVALLNKLTRPKQDRKK